MFEFLSFIGQYLYLFVLHICSSGSFPKPLSAKEEKEYIELAAKGDINARNKLVEHNLRLVAHIIKKYYSAQSNQEDLVSIGTIGLIKAVNTFKPDKNIRLSSYACRCIENEILMNFRNNRRQSLEISLDEAIDTDKDGNPLTLMDIIAAEDNIVDDLDTRMKCAKIPEYINEVLDPREKQIILLRYGLDGNKPLTQREIAALLGISRSYVSRIEKKALSRLRERFSAEEKAQPKSKKQGV